MENILFQYADLLLAYILSFASAFIAIPIVIKQSKKNNLLDKPDFRKQHKEPIPTMGGVGIFAGLIVSGFIWIDLLSVRESIGISVAISMLLVTGIVDDIKGLSAVFRLGIQCIGGVLAIQAGLVIHLPSIFQFSVETMMIIEYGVTIFLIAGVTNAFNLIDGIDGLAGGLGFINASMFGFLFLYFGNTGFAVLSFSFAAALLAFLKYNFNPARIFMGDTGSLVLGYLMIVFAIKVFNLSYAHTHSNTFILLVFSIVLVPVIDTARVFLFRILKGKSPFSADRSHIHHLLLKTGFNHKKASLILCFANIVLIVEAYLLRNVDIPLAILLLIVSAIFLIEIISIKRLFKIRTTVHILYNEYKKGSADNQLLLKYLNEKKKYE
ncbi:glycosyltransferase family 4 protein [Cytophaga hutchinsonii]|uniref:Glycosyltransferase family 4 protein n=1 Tax=Cytophaga hutchinsonii (strain ATCC 33406 / DSM 1761 / CIP 103989 / NBRC 15051 / NCIMB 9469 / D465) TaxID=269798 RepID=A0A6N4SUY8_CYTH3|nr:MraY family glycosyltransferase [Cytophaga hutchinsonii]ABG60135.1 glycosyltransferase family 4 protein [Cytophaga hutchinsonii ATCC 33406]SFX23434.1 UDP-N-acetylmuramyl pentapeptide phosphotransferase/UDP-N-acetylglucosamine-1-phosphate transferase [Cytophaga hutchinsonii ATCC 33406]